MLLKRIISHFFKRLKFYSLFQDENSLDDKKKFNPDNLIGPYLYNYSYAYVRPQKTSSTWKIVKAYDIQKMNF